MPTNAQHQALHDRATRGESLTAEEQASLEAWYAQQDQAEQQLLLDQAQPEALVHLRSQIRDATLYLNLLLKRKE